MQDWVWPFYAKGKCGNFTKDSKLSIEGLSACIFLEKNTGKENFERIILLQKKEELNDWKFLC